jgi:hypothetical protein
LRADFKTAIERYQAVSFIHPNDPVAALMEKRCREYMSGPQPTTWDTTFRMKDK